MHILFETKEKEFLQKVSFPEGTTLVEQNIDGDPLKRFIIEDGQFKMLVDFVEQKRPWKRGEEKRFLKDMTRERVFDFFLKGNEWDDTPQREYSTMSAVERKLFNFVSHAGTYQYDEESNEQRNIFRISLNCDSDLDAAEEEISWALPRIAKQFPKWKPIYIDIFEHTLSERGIYFLYWNRRKTFRLMKCTYSHEEELKRFTNLRSMLEYVSRNHYYEKVTR
jgi:hypothetical protein